MSDAAVARARLDAHAEAVLRAWDMVPETVVRRVVAARVGSAVVRCFPAADDDALLLITEVFTWLTAFDDHYERAGARTSLAVARLVASLERPDGVQHPPEGGPVVAAFAAVRARCRALLGPEQDDRLTDALRGYFLAVLWEQSAPGADADTFFAMRRHL
ncbi:terpene synthase family protein, partial [Streptomyces tsukubensis]|uniref:terpene synthase family protein n=1 Tax=Streptomyces tsukubensis TaxID=83656 RepID=UPI00347F8BBA